VRPPRKPEPSGSREFHGAESLRENIEVRSKPDCWHLERSPSWVPRWVRRAQNKNAKPKRMHADLALVHHALRMSLSESADSGSSRNSQASLDSRSRHGPAQGLHRQRPCPPGAQRADKPHANAATTHKLARMAYFMHASLRSAHGEAFALGYDQHKDVRVGRPLRST